MSAEMGVGAVVVCINDEWRPSHYGEVLPYRGQILTVRDILPGQAGDPLEDNLFLRFVEIVNPPHYAIDAARCGWGPEYGEATFRIEHFRPVRKTDISVFTEMLETLPLIVDLVE
jgi:hypothetical protein